MSHLLEFCPSIPPPRGSTSPPYIVFGIYGTDITCSLPPLIPLKLVLHFAPALRKWVLPEPDPAYLPRLDAEQSLRTPYIGIDILAPVDVVGLGWVILRMTHLSGRKVPRETFSIHPDLAISLSIHRTWLALELPSEGLRGLHMHIQAQLMLSSPPVCLWDMRMLWDTFPHDSEIVRAMGRNFVEALVAVEYNMHESCEILAWMQSTPELVAFLENLQNALPAFLDGALETLHATEDKEKALSTGYRTGGEKGGKTTNAAVAKEAAVQVDIMERGATRKVSPQERHEREISDFQAMQARLRRTKSDESLRSVDTAIWSPQEAEEQTQKGEEDEPVNGNMHDPDNYSGGSFSAELARTLDSIKLRREARRQKNSSSTDHLAVGLTTENLQQHNAEDDRPMRRHRRSSSTSTTGKEHSLLIAGLERRIRALTSRVRSSTPFTEAEHAVDDEREHSGRPRLRRKSAMTMRGGSPTGADAGSND